MKKSRILQGDCLDVLKGLPANSVDSIVTDPPYGLSKEPDIAEVMTHWIAGDHYKHGSAGFMGKTWDSFVPGPEYWRECLRVLKPGGHMLVFAGTRTWDLMSIAIRFAGGELRDTVQWVYGSGFPKSLSVGKAIDKAAGAKRKVVGMNPNHRGESQMRNPHTKSLGQNGSITVPHTPDAKKWEGFGTALKPAWEPILVFRKPLEKGLSIAENVLKWGCGGINVDASRIQAADQHVLDAAVKRMTGNAANAGAFQSSKSIKPNSAQGRFPANLLMSHTLFCVQKGVKRVKGNQLDHECSGSVFVGKNRQRRRGHTDARGMETVEAWECHESCPVRELDRQSGAARSSGSPSKTKRKWTKEDGTVLGFGQASTYYSDSGGASRFFYVCKPSRRERNAGCEGLGKGPAPASARSKPAEGRQNALGEPRGNHHPCVKPQALMRYLIKMTCPPGGTVLDPFAGSGTTLAAAKSLGFRFIGIEQSKAYVRIARARVKAA